MSCACTHGHRPETISGVDAARLYRRLRPYLRVVWSGGCHVPARKGVGRFSGDHGAWPLHAWRGPGAWPLVVTFGRHQYHGGKDARHPTFEEFCRVYRLTVIEEAP